MAPKIFMVRLLQTEDGKTVWKNGEGCELYTSTEPPGVIIRKKGEQHDHLVPWTNICKVLYDQAAQTVTVAKAK